MAIFLLGFRLLQNLYWLFLCNKLHNKDTGPDKQFMDGISTFFVSSGGVKGQLFRFCNNSVSFQYCSLKLCMQTEVQ